MRKLILNSLLISMFLITGSVYSQESISMGSGYENDVFYSMENGLVAVADRAEWDLGFYTSPWSAGIITNGGSGVDLYCYPYGDTTSWMSIDTSGIASWAVLYNGEDSWENGAFNRNSGNHPDYGWGVYNATTHNVDGDSLFVIKLADGTYKKLWIVKKISIENKYVIRYADLDNSNEMEKVLDNNGFLDMNFSYFTFAGGALFAREPVKESWDILFTKYQAMQPQGVPYPVVGVLNNVYTKANRFHTVAMDYTDWYTQELDSLKAVIGFDWKYFDMQAFQWSLEDSLVYFVNPLSDNIYKMYFTLFEGSSTGNIEFMKEMVSTMEVDEFATSNVEMQLIPNPATHAVSVSWNQELNSDAMLSIYDLSGKVVQTHRIGNGSGSKLNINVSSLKEGMYIVSIQSGEQVFNKKLMIR